MVGRESRQAEHCMNEQYSIQLLDFFTLNNYSLKSR